MSRRWTWPEGWRVPLAVQMWGCDWRGKDGRWEAWEGDRAGKLRLRERVPVCGHIASGEEEWGQEPGLSTSRSCPGQATASLRVTTGTHACASKSPPGRSLPRAPLGSSRASFRTIGLIVIGIWKHCKNACLLIYGDCCKESVGLRKAYFLP